MSESQSTSQVLMVRPVRFAGNLQTAASNRFQNLNGQYTAAAIQAQALAEFEHLAAMLHAADVQVHVLDDTPEPHTPDSIFPNNWVSFHADGTVVWYPLLAPNRRLERRADVLPYLSEQGLNIRRVVDLSHHEADDKFLEGTGSLVLDRVHRVAYACVSPRTDLDVLAEFARRLDYALVTFAAVDGEGVPIYHTNVLMSIGTHFAVLCTAAVAVHDQAAVLQALHRSGHAVIEISLAQMHAFAGNLLELQTRQGDLCVALSQSAHTALTAAQRAQLQTLAGPLLATPIPTIERLGGGSVRCMLAEVFLPTTTAWS